MCSCRFGPSLRTCSASTAIILAFFRLARVEAEALVWHHGSEGVTIARTREARSAGAPRVQRLHDWLVRLLAERSYDLLRGVDVGTRYDVACRLGAAAGADDRPLTAALAQGSGRLTRQRAFRTRVACRLAVLGQMQPKREFTR